MFARMHDFSLRKRFVVGIVTPRKTILSHEQATKSAHHLAKKQTVSQTNRKKPWGIKQAMKSSNHSVGHHHLHVHLRHLSNLPSHQPMTHQWPTSDPPMTHQWPTNDTPQLHQGLRFGEAALQNAWSQGAAALPHRRWCQGEHLKARNFGTFLSATSLVNPREFCFVLGDFVGIWEFLGEFEVFLFCLLWFVFEICRESVLWHLWYSDIFPRQGGGCLESRCLVAGRNAKWETQQ